MNSTFLSDEEIKKIGIKKIGKNVLIGKNVILYSPEKLVIGDNVRIDDFTIISGNVILHSYIHISQFCGLYGGEEGIEMEDYSGLSSRVSVYSVSDDYTGKSMTNPMIPLKYKPTMISEKVLIKKHSIIGVNSVILPGVTIGEGCSLGAMSFVNKSLDDWGIYVGNPVRRVKDRSKELLVYEREFEKNK